MAHRSWHGSNLRSPRWARLLGIILGVFSLAVMSCGAVLAAENDSLWRLAMPTPIPFSDDAESGIGGWTWDGSWAITTEWQPKAGSTDNHSWSDSPGADYAVASDSYLTSPTIDLEGAATGYGEPPLLFFDGRAELGDAQLLVEFSRDGGATWEQSYLVVTGTRDYIYCHTGIAARLCSDEFKFRLHLRTFSGVPADGVHLDNFRILVDATDHVFNTDSRLTYYGKWDSAPWPDGMFYTYSYSVSPRPALVFSFTGSYVQMYAKMGPQYGIAEVSVDGGSPERVDLYKPWWDPSKDGSQLIYETGDLADGPHTLVMTASGDKNPSATGYAISINRFSVWGVATDSPKPTRYEQDYGDFEYAGIWDATADSSASAGSFLSCDAGGAAASVSFMGTGLSWIGRTAPWYGKARVSLDDGPLEEVDLYRSTIRFQERVYDTGLLEEGQHTLDIYWTGDKNPASWGTRVSLDAFDIFGTPTEAEPAPVVPCRYQENDPRIVYIGDWISAADRAASGGSFKCTRPQAMSGTAALFTFHGTELTLLCRTTPWYGWADVYIDETLHETLDLYSTSVICGNPVGHISGLGDADHRVVLKYRSTRSDVSAGYSISLDAIETDGYLVQGEPQERYEEDQAEFEYVGDWLTIPNGLASGGAYAYTDAQGSSVNLTFRGTNLIWYARTAPWYGSATVFVDDGHESGVPIYLGSRSVRYGQKVFDTGLLDYGVHTVRIYCGYYPRSYDPNSGINIDAIQVVGELIDASPAAPIGMWYNQDDPRIIHLGDWLTVPISGLTSTNYGYTDARGAAVLMEFNGTEVCLASRVAPWYGKALITLDGLESEVDLYSSRVTRRDVFWRTGLSPGPHTLSIECLAENSGQPGGGYGISLESVWLEGYLTHAPKPTRIQENDASWLDSGDPAAEIVFEGSWAASGNTGWRASGNSFASVDRAGAKVTVNFHGTHLSWLGRNTPWYGRAKVTVDGDTASAVTVDLWGPTTRWKVPVYNTGLLDEGDHTVVIECLGSKYWRSWGTAVAVDAFDVMTTAAP